MRAVEKVGVHVKYNPINTCVIVIDARLLKALLKVHIHLSMRAVEKVGVHVKYNPINTCVIVIDARLLKALLDFG